MLDANQLHEIASPGTIGAMIESRRERRPRAPQTGQVPVMPGWSIWVGALVLLVVAAASMWLLLSLFGTANEQDKIRLEIVKLAGSIVVGTGGAAALLLAARRQRSTELGLAQAERDLAYKEQAAADARHDASERRITELDTAAAEQLASNKAPVRLAGLYALERLGRVDPDLRQTIVKLFCAYLRMPYSHVLEEAISKREKEKGGNESRDSIEQRPLFIELGPNLAAAAGVQLDGEDQRSEELQVRITAQRLLSEHLVYVDGQPNPQFWGEEGNGFNLDLSGATLHNWDLRHARVGHADFSGARFYGNTKFKDSVFQGVANFQNSHFSWGYLFFTGSQFRKRFVLDHVKFNQNMIDFDQSEFIMEPSFRDLNFPEQASFQKVWFHAGVEFPLGSFRSVPNLTGAQIKEGNYGAFLPMGWTLGKRIDDETSKEVWREIVADE